MVAGPGPAGAGAGASGGGGGGGNGVVTTLKKTKRRTTEKILQKIGASEACHDDKEFNELHGEFVDTHKQLLLLLSKFQLYVEAIEKWQRCGEALAKEFGNFVSSGRDEDCEARKSLEEVHACFAATQDEMGVVCSNLVDKWSVQILSPLRDVAFTLNNAVKEKVAERAADKIDFDVYRRRAKSLAAPEGGKTAKAAKTREARKNFAKLTATQQRYEENDAFLLHQFRRMRNERSLVVLHELSLAVHFQNEFVKSMQRVSQECFKGNLEAHLPEDALEGFDKRMNQWVVQGGAQTQKAAGYDTVGTLAESTKAGGGPKGRIERQQSARHYARNAPRGKQVFLKNIGRQLSLERKQPAGKKSDFVLPNKEDLTDISIVSYKSTLPLEAPVTPVNLKSRNAPPRPFQPGDAGSDGSADDADPSRGPDADAKIPGEDNADSEPHEADLSAVEEEDGNYLSSAKSCAMRTTSSERTINTVVTDEDEIDDDDDDDDDAQDDEDDLDDEAMSGEEGDGHRRTGAARDDTVHLVMNLDEPHQQGLALDAETTGARAAGDAGRGAAAEEGTMGDEIYEDDFEDDSAARERKESPGDDHAIPTAAHNTTIGTRDEATHRSSLSADKNIVKVMNIDCVIEPKNHTQGTNKTTTA